MAGAGFGAALTLDQLRGGPWAGSQLAPTTADHPAAIIFTTGSTGPPKGVLYTHGNFDAQVEQIRDFYGIQPGEIDLPAFPLFGLFNCAMGVTAVIPDMDPSRPARSIPPKLSRRSPTGALPKPSARRPFGTAWPLLPVARRSVADGPPRALGRAPVPAEVLRRMKACIHPDGDVHTPYGATEALPVASIAASEVLSETAERTCAGGGVCVGRTIFRRSVESRSALSMGRSPRSTTAEELPPGEIGELIVHGPR